MGSVCGMPDFGSRINEVIFEPIDHITKDLLQRLIAEAIYKFEDRIILMSVNVQEIPEYNRVICTIEFKFRDDILNRIASTSFSLLN